MENKTLKEVEDEFKKTNQKIKELENMKTLYPDNVEKLDEEIKNLKIKSKKLFKEQYKLSHSKEKFLFRIILGFIFGLVAAYLAFNENYTGVAIFSALAFWLLNP